MRIQNNKKEISPKETSFDCNYEYWLKLIRKNSSSAEMISRIRWDFVSKVKPRLVLDYGAGPCFFSAFKPKGVQVDTYDVMPIPQTGINHKFYDLITFWDVLGHIPDLKTIESLLNITKAVAVAMPILPLGQDLKTWKHYKPNENVRVFTKETLQQYFRNFGFRLIKSGYPECDCGIRQDILSALFKKKTIVFTNGVFDLLHVGHLSLLKKARSLGDRLVVAIDSDVHTKTLGKKPPRPINEQGYRKKVLESIKWVDEVLIFDDLEKTIRKVRPNIIVKGGDYKESEVVGRDIIKEWGGEVHIVPLMEGQSTTAVINKIRNL